MTIPRTMLAAALSAAACTSPEVAWLSPSPEAAPLLDAALEAWAEAGVPVDDVVHVGPGGAPVTITQGEPRPGSRGLTYIRNGRVQWVRVQATAPARTWAHEVGHVLGAYDHSPGACVMASPSDCAVITAEDLALAGW